MHCLLCFLHCFLWYTRDLKVVPQSELKTGRRKSWFDSRQKRTLSMGKKKKKKQTNDRSIQVSVHYAHCVCFHSWRFWRDTLSNRMEYYRVKSWLASFCLRVNKVLWWQFSSSNLNINTHVLSYPHEAAIEHWHLIVQLVTNTAINSFTQGHRTWSNIVQGSVALRVVITTHCIIRIHRSIGYPVIYPLDSDIPLWTTGNTCQKRWSKEQNGFKNEESKHKIARKMWIKHES